MLLTCAGLQTIENDKPKLRFLREERLQYQEILKEVHSALTLGYELTYISSDEFNHIVTFLRYKSGDKEILILTVRGTREEIENLQQDPIVKNSQRNR